MKRILKRISCAILITVLVVLFLYLFVSISFELPLILMKNVDIGHDANTINYDAVSNVISREPLDYTLFGCYNEYYLYTVTNLPDWVFDLWIKPPWIYLLVDTNPKNNKVTLIYFIGEDLTISTAICKYVGSSEISINQVFIGPATKKE